MWSAFRRQDIEIEIERFENALDAVFEVRALLMHTSAHENIGGQLKLWYMTE